jgi:hypothetical protein
MKTPTLIHPVTCRRALAALLASLFPVLAAQAQSAAPGLRYDQVQQRFIHNAYSNGLAPKDEQLLDQLIHHRVRGLELDLMPQGYPCYTAGPPDGPPNWYIYHDCAEGHLRTTVNTLGDALDLFKAFHDAQPQHEVVTVYLELASNEGLKGSRSEFSSYSPDELDELIRGRLGNAVLFTPADLLAWGGERPDATGSLHRVVSTLGWPTTDDLRGKFIFLIHGEASDEAQYFGLSPEPDLAQIYRRVAFYMDNSALWRTPGYSANPAAWAVVHSEISAEEMPQLRRDLPGHILKSALSNDEAEVEALQRGGANLISTDSMDVEEHPFIRFYNGRLYPFAASVPKSDGTFPAGMEAWSHPAVAGKAEPGRIFILGDRSGGDIGGDQDEFVFAPLTLPPSGEPEIWTAEIASASNRLHSAFGKGFLMARASDAPDAPYCAVGRAADVLGLRMQYRSDYGLGTASTLLDSLFLIRPDRENKHFVRLELIPQDGGQSTLCRAFGSLDGRSWVQFGDDAYFPGIQLTQRGLAVTSGPDLLGPFLGLPLPYTKIDFVSLERSVGGRPPQPLDPGSFDVQAIGGAEEPFALRIAQSAITCTDLVAQSEPGVCGAHVNLQRAIGDHGGTVRFSAAPDQLFPVGVTPVQATTPGGASCSFKVTVEDVERPVIQAALAVPALSRIGGELVNVGLTASVTDNCAGVSAVQVAVSSDESDTEAGSNFSPDARDIAPGSLRLREERNSRADGRVYLLLLRAVDTTGNAGWTSRTVVLPVSQSEAAADAVNAQEAAARAYADANGAPPSGFVAVGGGPVLGPKQ